MFTRWLAAPAAASGGTPHETHGDTSQDAPSTTPGAGSHDPPADATENAPTKNAPSSPTPRLTLYRWWTDACPFCESSLPAMEALRLKYENEGLRVVGAYHPKPPRHVDDAFVRAAAARLGFAGEIAVDEQWSMLKEAYLKSGRRRATSISMLVDADGVIRFVHPGPELFPSTNPSNGRQNSDFELLEHAVRQLLALDDARPGPPGAPNAPSAGNTDAR